MAEETKVKSKKPLDTAFWQQRLPAGRPIFTPLCVGIIFIIIGIPLVVVGNVVLKASSELTEVTKQYDNDPNCKILYSGAHAKCDVKLTAPNDMKAPVYVYYELSNFYQNHRRYLKSYDRAQLLGCTSATDTPTGGASSCGSYNPTTQCDPFVSNGTRTYSPCGLIAGSLFNDVILLSSAQSIRYDGTAWPTDTNKYIQPHGFTSVSEESGYAEACIKSFGKDAPNGKGPVAPCSDAQCKDAFKSSSFNGCKAYACPAAPSYASYLGCEPGKYSMFWYPNDAKTQYLYESFPEVVTPMLGVKTARFQVWMRTAALSRFRKLYAVINHDLKMGEEVKFAVTANFDVSAIGGTKSLVLTTTSWFGAKNDFLGVCFVVVGSISLAFGVAFGVKHLVSPRPLGDLRYLQ
jgi:hypothetical protein